MRAGAIPWDGPTSSHWDTAVSHRVGFGIGPGDSYGSLPAQDVL